MKLNQTPQLFRNAADAPVSPAPDAPPAAVIAPLETPEAAPDLSWIGADYLVEGKPNVEGFKAHYQDLIAEQARRAEAPQPPADGKYDFALPADLDFGEIKLPEGQTVAIDTSDPAFAPLFDELGQWLHTKGMPQSEATAVMSMLGKYKAAEIAKGHAAAVAEWDTLGPTEAARSARVATVQRALETRLSAGDAKAVMAVANSAASVRALQNLLSVTSGPRAPNHEPTPPMDPLAARYPSYSK